MVRIAPATRQQAARLRLGSCCSDLRTDSLLLVLREEVVVVIVKDHRRAVQQHLFGVRQCDEVAFR